MTKTVSLNEAQHTLPALIHSLATDEVVTITENDQPVAQIVPCPLISVRPPRRRPAATGIPKAGTAPGLVVPDNFKEPLEELREYME